MKQVKWFFFCVVTAFLTSCASQQSGEIPVIRVYAESDIPSPSAQENKRIILFEIRDLEYSISSIWISEKEKGEKAYVKSGDDWDHIALLMINPNKDYTVNVKRSDGKWAIIAQKVDESHVDLEENFPVYVNGVKLEPKETLEGPLDAGKASFFLPARALQISDYEPEILTGLPKPAYVPSQPEVKQEDFVTRLQRAKAIQSLREGIDVYTQLRELYMRIMNESSSESLQDRLKFVDEQITKYDELLKKLLEVPDQAQSPLIPSDLPQIRLTQQGRTFTLEGEWKTMNKGYIQSRKGDWSEFQKYDGKSFFEVSRIPPNLGPLGAVIYDVQGKKTLQGNWELISMEVLIFIPN